MLASGDGGAFAVIALFVIAIVVIYALIQSSTQKDNLQNAIRKYGGRLAGGWLSDTDAEMKVDGVPVTLGYFSGSKNRSAYTRMRFLWTPPGRLRVAVEGFWASLTKAFGAEDIVVGDPAFDGAYIVQGAPVTWVREVLDDETRARLNGIAGMAAGFLSSGGITLEAGPGGVMIGVARNFAGDAGRLERFVDESVGIFHRLRAPATAGIEILSAEESAAQGRCPVCDHPLGEKIRKCPACATPHHGDCWEYFGGCSTYACARRGGA